MKTYGTVQFNFTRNMVDLGMLSIPGLSTTGKQVQLSKMSAILARSEKVLFVKCSTQNALLEGDFEPKIELHIRGLYAI